MAKNIHKLGNLTRDDISFPEHLTPEVIHIALFIHNAECKKKQLSVLNMVSRQQEKRQ